jgi:hypothetical protein
MQDESYNVILDHVSFHRLQDISNVQMGDPLSLISGIAAIQLTENVWQALSDADAKGASTLCHRILVEIGNISGLLSRIESLVDEAESGEGWLATVRPLGAPNGPLAQFKLALEQVASLATQIEPTSRLKRAGGRFAWPFKKCEVMDILCTFERQKTLFVLALQNYHM